MNTSLRNWITIITVFLGANVTIYLAPAFGQSQSDLERLVRIALENAPLVERVESLAVSDSAFNGESERFVSAAELPAKIVEITIVFNPSDTVSSTKRGIEQAMMDGYQAIFTHDFPVSRGEIEARMMLIDPFGNQVLGLVYGTAITAEEAERVNWEDRHNFDPSEVWDAYFMNRAFQQ